MLLVVAGGEGGKSAHSPLNKSSLASIMSSSDVVQFGGVHGLDIGDKVQLWVENLRKWIAASVLKPLVKLSSSSCCYEKSFLKRHKFSLFRTTFVHKNGKRVNYFSM